MANEKTKQEWITIRDEAQKELDSLRPQLAIATAELAKANTEFNNLSGKENQLSDDPNSAEYKAAKQARQDYYRTVLRPAQLNEQSLRDQVNAANRDYNYSSEQAAIASSGPPDTNTNTPPVNTTPNQPNTELPPVNQTAPNDTSTVVNQNTDPTQVDEFAGFEEAIARQKVITDNADLGQLGINTDLSQTVSTDDNAPYATSNTRGISGKVSSARSQANMQDSVNFALQQDWRVRLVLAENADYLYKADNPGILQPLIATKGIIFPYTPIIAVTYTANYDPQSIAHSNYKVLQYQSSAVENVSITCDFTAQDTTEANYFLAVIHFLRSATKMFYGQDEKPKLGTPPPLLYLKGYGAFQFDMHPLVVQTFTYNLPNDVDYIRASATTTLAGVTKDTNNSSEPNSRLSSVGVAQGGNPKPVVFSNPTSGTVEPTYVPTKAQVQIQCIPVVSRKDISDRFSFRDYATGALLRGSKNNNAGIW